MCDIWLISDTQERLSEGDYASVCYELVDYTPINIESLRTIS